MTLDQIIAADPGSPLALDDRIDFRFDITRNPEPDQASDMFFVEVIATYYGEDAGLVERFTTDDPGSAVEAARIAQAYPDMEEREGVYNQMADFYGMER
jgi:hypothetical protein